MFDPRCMHDAVEEVMLRIAFTTVNIFNALLQQDKTPYYILSLKVRACGSEPGYWQGVKLVLRCFKK